MTDITIERAHAADAGSVVALLDAAAEWQRDHGIDLWTPGQFNEDVRVVQPDGAAGVYGVVHPKFLAAGIVALDHDDRVLLVGQHRYTLDLLTWGIPGGGVPFDEDPLEGAKRELAEETGYTAATWHELARFTLSNSITDGRGVVFLATDLSEGMPNGDGTEVGMTARSVPFSEALDLVDSGEVHDVFTQVGLLAADRYLRGRS